MFQTVQQCGQESPVPVDGTVYRVENNKFNPAASGQSECISIDTATTNFSVTNSSIAVPTDDAPGGYPSIYQGCHWGTCSNNSVLPLQISNIASATSSWSTTQPNSAASSNDAWDVAYDLWFNHASSTGARPDGAELMIWPNHRGPPQPEGAPLPNTLTINGITYQVWENASASPPYIAYVMKQGTASVSNLDLLAIINDATFNRHFIDPSLFLISVEAGLRYGTGAADWPPTHSFSAPLRELTGGGGNNSGLSSAPLNIWWSTDSSQLSGTQPFKARLREYSSFFVQDVLERRWWSTQPDERQQHGRRPQRSVG